MTQGTNYDLFISYADADRAWVEGYLMDALKQAGIRYYSEAAFALGHVRILEFERAVQQSQRTLLVLSPAYLANDVNQFVDLLAQGYGLDTATWPVIPLILQPVQLPPRLNILVKLNATNEEEQQEAIERLCAELKRPVPAPSLRPSCPYPGMVPFSEEESDRFFGRDQEIQELLECLRLHPFLTVIGPSGSGKSSLVFAGFIPKLRNTGLFGGGEWLICSIRPGKTPLSTLETALGSSLTDPVQAVTEALRASPAARRLLLVVDQFEETFTVSEQQAIPFQETLQHLVAVPNCYVILTVRADFYPELMTSPLWRQIQSHRFEVIPLDDAGLRQAIIKPSENVRVFVEPTLVERLVVDAAGEPGFLPLVQETLVLLWERVERRFLPLRAYEALILPRSAYGALSGNSRTGLQVAIARRADAALADLLSHTQQVIARRIFLRLVQFGEGRADTRRQQSVDDLRAASDEPYLFDQTLRHLVDCRLLTLSGEEDSSTKVDIAHEALIVGWPALQQWISERREAEQIRRRLTAQAQEWVRLGRSNGGLLDNIELAEAERWLPDFDALNLGYDEVLPALIKASKTAIQEAEREKEERQQRELQLVRERLEEEKKARKAAQTRNRIAVTSLIVLTGLTALAINRFIDSRIQLLNSLASSSEALLASHKELEALIDAIKAGKLLKQQAFITPSDVQMRVVAALRKAIYETQEINRLPHKNWVYDVSFSPNGQMLASASKDKTVTLWKRNGQKIKTLPYNAEVHTVRFSPDGQMLASASKDKTVRLWTLDGRLLKTLLGHSAEVFYVSFSPDRQILASASADKTVKLWKRDGKLLSTLQGHNDKVFTVTFSPDSKTIASTSADKTIKLWSRDGKLIQNLQGHSNKVFKASFSPDGKTIASASEDRTVKLWSRDGKLLRTFEQGTSPVLDVNFSPDGKTIVSANEDKTVKLWSRDGKLLRTLQGHELFVSVASFSPDGKELASASYDNTIRLWSVKPKQPAILQGHRDKVLLVSFSPSGQMLASASNDRTIKLWSRDGKLLKTLQGHQDAVRSLRFSPNGQILASASRDRTIKLWNLRGNLLKTLKGHQDMVRSISFSPDSQTIVSASPDGTIKFWNTVDGQLIRTIKGDKEGGWGVSFSPDGKRITYITGDGTIKLLTLDGILIQALKGREAGISTANFSPDGQMIALGLNDGTIRLLKHDGSPITTFIGHTGGVEDLSFSPDSKIIASASRDRTIKFWNLEGTLLQTFQGDDWVLGISFSPDSKIIASANYDNTVRLWNLDLENLLNNGCVRLDNHITYSSSLNKNNLGICTN